MSTPRDDIRCFRYRITTPTMSVHEYSGRRTYDYLRAVLEADGKYVEEAREDAAQIMREAVLLFDAPTVGEPLPKARYGRFTVEVSR